jgi:hypothetical protein
MLTKGNQFIPLPVVSGEHLSLPPVEVGTDYFSCASELTTGRGRN